MTQATSIAVLGASGFVGTRLVEMLHLGGGEQERVEVRPIVRSFSSIARLSHFDLDWRIADANDAAALRNALAGCDVVVSAISGGLQIHERAIEPVYLAAQDAGVRRLVHISSTAVHRQPPVPGTDENSPLDDAQAMPYNNAKARAEHKLAEMRSNGRLETVVLRPGIVFGPRSRWISDYADQLLAGTAYLIHGGSGICNSIYIDNLVHAIRLAATSDDADREAFIVGDDEVVTWAEFALGVAEPLGFGADDFATVEATPAAARDRPGIKARLRQGRFAKYLKRAKPHVPDRAIRTVRAALGAWQTPPRPTPYAVGPAPKPSVTLEMSVIQRCQYKLPHAKAEKQLGYSPIVSFEEGMRRSVAWLGLAGYPVGAAPGTSADS